MSSLESLQNFEPLAAETAPVGKQREIYTGRRTSSVARVRVVAEAAGGQQLEPRERVERVRRCGCSSLLVVLVLDQRHVRQIHACAERPSERGAERRQPQH